DHEEDGDCNQPPIDMGHRRQDFAWMAFPENEGGEAGGDRGARPPSLAASSGELRPFDMLRAVPSNVEGPRGLRPDVQGVPGRVVRCRSGSCFTWYARTRN